MKPIPFVLLLAAQAASIACAGPTTTSVTGKVLGQEFGITHQSGPPPTTTVPGPALAPPGFKFKLTHYGPDGSVLDSNTSSSLPMGGTTPPGTASSDVTSVQCPPAHFSGSIGAVRPPKATTRPRFSATYQLTGAGDQWAFYSVTAATNAQADNLAREYIDQGLSVSQPVSIETHYRLFTTISAGDLRLDIVSDEPITSLDLHFNGLTYILADAALSNINGWQVASITIPGAAINTGTGATNELDFGLDTTVESGLAFEGELVW